MPQKENSLSLAHRQSSEHCVPLLESIYLFIFKQLFSLLCNRFKLRKQENQKKLLTSTHPTNHLTDMKDAS